MVAVVAADELRAEREEGRDLAALEGRSGRQLSQEEKAERATHVIVNDGSLAELESKRRRAGRGADRERGAAG